MDIVKAIVEMAHSLRLKVIAEGVETADQLFQVHELGCNYVQGFLFSLPVDAKEAGLLFRETRELGPLALASPSLISCETGR